jgi:hypothetical protein
MSQITNLLYVLPSVSRHAYNYNQRPNSESLTGGIRRLWHRVVGNVPSGYLGWQAVTTTLCHSRLYPPVRDYVFGNRKYCGYARSVIEFRYHTPKFWPHNSEGGPIK